MKLDGDQLRLKLSEKVDALYEAKDAHNAEILKAAITQEDVSVDISDIPENKRYIAVKKGIQRKEKENLCRKPEESVSRRNIRKS